MTELPNDPGEERLDRLTAGLPRSIEPPDDLWPAIRSQIAPPRRQLAWRGWQVAAALLLVALSSLVTWLVVRRNAPVAPAVAVEAGTDAVALYAAAAGDMAHALGDSTGPLAGMSPETRALLQRNLAVIDSVIAECRAALAADTANPMLRQLLGGAERQRLDFLRQASRLPRS